MKSELEDFDGDTDADLAAYVQAYRTRIADMTDEIDAKERGEIDQVMRDAIATLKWERGKERERLEQIKDEQAAYVQACRTRIADMTDEIDAKERGEIDQVMRDAIATLKWERGEERERLEQIKDEQAAYVQACRTRIADMTDEIDAKERGEIDQVMRDAIATLKWERGGERERLEQIKDEQKRRAAEAKG